MCSWCASSKSDTGRPCTETESNQQSCLLRFAPRQICDVRVNKMKAKHIVIASWLTLALSVLPEAIAALRFAWPGKHPPISHWLARVIQHRAAFIPLTQWFLMATLFLGWLTWRRFRSDSGKTLLFAAGLPLLLSLLINLYEIQTWYCMTKYNLGPQERGDPVQFLKPLGEAPNNRSEGIRQPADGLPKATL